MILYTLWCALKIILIMDDIVILDLSVIVMFEQNFWQGLLAVFASLGLLYFLIRMYVYER